MSLKFWAHTSFYYYDMDRPWKEMAAEMVDICQAAEDLGFEGVTIPENHFNNYISNPNALQFASYVAARTERIRIVPGVIVLPQYHPLLIASNIALIDNLAPGRVGVGIARGGNRYPTDRTGINADNIRGMFEEGLEILRKVWVEDDVTYDGTYYSFPETTLVPKPVVDPEIWIAAQSSAGVRNVALQGHNLITSPNHGDFEPHGDLDLLMETFNTASAESGKERGEVMVLRHTFIHEDEQQALEKVDEVVLHWNHYMATVQGSGTGTSREHRLAAREDLVDGIIKGGRVIPDTNVPDTSNVYDTYDDPILTNPARAVERFKHYEEIGVDHVSCLTAMGFAIDEVLTSMELMAKEVFPAFADPAS